MGKAPLLCALIDGRGPGTVTIDAAAISPQITVRTRKATVYTDSVHTASIDFFQIGSI